MPDPTSISRDVLEGLMLDIEEEKCVLLIGPEVIQSGGRSQTRFVHEQAMELEAGHIDYYYPNDSLFLFKDDADKNRVARRVKRLYRNMEPPLEVYQKILELPIPLVVCLNPDTFLADAAQQFGLAYDFSHFRFTGEATKDVEAPTAGRPLFYNLCGCRTEEESLVLDYEDLFRLLRAVLPDGLPNKVRMKLREASSFLFLGFDFEKWYTQLLLQLLTGDRKGRPKFAFRSNMHDGNAKDFLIHQFQLQFLGEGQHFFDSLHQLLAGEGLLRQLSPLGPSRADALPSIRQRVAEGAVEEALAMAGALPMSGGQRDKLVLLQNRFNNWKKDQQAGVFLPGQAEPILNGITRDFLGFLNGELA